MLLFDNPKSVSLMYPSAPIRTFSGFRLNKIKNTHDRQYFSNADIPRPTVTELHKISPYIS
jgi:hypothetical protein